MSLLRQSNFLAKSVRKFDSSRQLTRGDVSICKKGLLIVIRWEKNMQCSLRSSSVLLPRTSTSSLCPVSLFLRMCALSPTRSCRDPLIMFRDANHMPLSFVQKVWNSILLSIGHQPTVMRLHGLRRGGATYIAGSSPQARSQLQRYGRWKSNVYDKYIGDPATSSVYEALSML